MHDTDRYVYMDYLMHFQCATELADDYTKKNIFLFSMEEAMCGFSLAYCQSLLLVLLDASQRPEDVPRQ